MLKKNTSTVNDLSSFSRKARERGREEISVLYAFDLDEMEIICGEVFPGNEPDSTAYPAFIKDNNLNRGLIINDKGFPPSSIEEQLKTRPDLHFLTPIKKNDSRIKNNNMLEFSGVLENIEKRVLVQEATDQRRPMALCIYGCWRSRERGKRQYRPSQKEERVLHRRLQ